ncbi:SdpI family protein, partial [Dorea longicatena]
MAALSPIVVCSSYAIALGINVNITLLTYLIIGLMLLVIGNYLAKTKQNYSAGIRIPWTLSSEENWNRTHRFSSRLFIFCGLAMIANGFLDSKILLFFIMAVLIVIPYAYSFFLFKKGI